MLYEIKNGVTLCDTHLQLVGEEGYVCGVAINPGYPLQKPTQLRPVASAEQPGRRLRHHTAKEGRNTAQTSSLCRAARQETPASHCRGWTEYSSDQ